MIDLLVNIKNFFLTICAAIFQAIKYCIYTIFKLPQKAKILATKLSNLTDVNIELAEFHLQNNNIFDAIIRLKIIRKFSALGNANNNSFAYKRASYLLAWCYILRCDISSAKTCLEQCRDLLCANELRQYLLCDDPEIIPRNILLEYKKLAPSSYLSKFTFPGLDLCDQVTKTLLKHLQNMPEDLQILDLGGVKDFLAQSIVKHIAHNYSISVVEDDSAMRDILQNSNLYTNIYNQSIEDFLPAHLHRYDGIISICSLAFCCMLHKYFDLIKICLKQHGYFLLVMPGAEKTKISSNRCEFLYNRIDIEKSLHDTGFKILDNLRLKGKDNDFYHLWVCKIDQRV